MPDALSHYSLLEKLGTGGMGTVYRAADQTTGAIVALKTLHPHLAADAEYVRRFEAEARIAQSIDSPNVVKVLDYGHEGDTYFLVMEDVPGRSLAEIIQTRGDLPVDEAVSIAAAIARALVAANARAIVHRDISPQNVMITPAGVAKVTDFGVSRDLTQNTMTATSMLMGKPLYIAPEVATGASKADIRADIYALGVILFQMLTGRVPFDAPTPFGVMQKHVSEPVPSLERIRAGLPVWLVEVVGRCLAKDATQRYQGPGGLLDALDTGNREQTLRVERFSPANQEASEAAGTIRERPHAVAGAPIPEAVKVSSGVDTAVELTQHRPRETAANPAPKPGRRRPRRLIAATVLLPALAILVMSFVFVSGLGKGEAERRSTPGPVRQEAGQPGPASAQTAPAGDRLAAAPSAQDEGSIAPGNSTVPASEPTPPPALLAEAAAPTPEPPPPATATPRPLPTAAPTLAPPPPTPAPPASAAAAPAEASRPAKPRIVTMGCKTKKDPVPQPSNDVTVHASPEEPIRCDAVIEGEYTAITWSGPSSTSGTGLHFEWASTSQSSAGFIHGPGQVIRLQVDWWGGAESQRVFIFIE